jgi:hypothetical protein
MALCCLYGFLLEGFTLFSLVGRLLTVMVTTPGCIWCYGVVVYVLNHLLVTAYLFHLVVGSFYVIGIHTVGYGWLLCQEACFRVVGSTWALHFYQHYSETLLGKNTRVMPASRFRFWPGLSLGCGLDSLINFCYFYLVCYPWREVCYLVWLSSLGFASRMILCQG